MTAARRPSTTWSRMVDSRRRRHRRRRRRRQVGRLAAFGCCGFWLLRLSVVQRLKAHTIPTIAAHTFGALLVQEPLSKELHCRSGSCDQKKRHRKGTGKIKSVADWCLNELPAIAAFVACLQLSSTSYNGGAS